MREFPNGIGQLLLLFCLGLYYSKWETGGFFFSRFPLLYPLPSSILIMGYSSIILENY